MRKLLGPVLVLLALAIAALGMMLFIAASRKPPPQIAQWEIAEPLDGLLAPLEDRRPRLGEPAPDFRLRDLEGKVIQLSALRGKVVVINFWATWCGPCREEFPELEKVHREQRDQGVVILAINVGEPAERAASFREQVGSTFPILLDPGNEVFSQYGLRGVPDSIFVDRDGIVRDIVYGPLSRGTLVYKINQLRKASTGSR